MSDKHNKMGNICAALCVIVCILLMIGLVLAPTSLFILLGIGNLIAGTCLSGGISDRSETGSILRRR